MRDLVRGRNCAGHGRMCDDPLEEELRPARAIKLRGVIRQRLAADATEQSAATEWPIDDYGNAALLRDRQDTLLRFAFHERVVDLHEVDLLTLKHARDFRLRAGGVVRDADVTHASFFLP